MQAGKSVVSPGMVEVLPFDLVHVLKHHLGAEVFPLCFVLPTELLARLRRVAARPIHAPFGKNERVISLREREA